MPIIGTFSAVKDGYAGTIRTLTMSVRVRLVANDRKEADGAPDFRIVAGTTEIGAAWRRTSKGIGGDLPERQARRSRPAAADLGRPARGHRRRPRAPRLAARPEGRRLRLVNAEASSKLKPQPIPEPRPAARAALRQRSPIARSEPHVPCASRRLRAAALRGRLLPLLPVPLHQRADRRRPHAPSWASARPTSACSRRCTSWCSPRSCSPAACSSTATGRASSTAPCSSLPPPARSCSPSPTASARSLSAARSSASASPSA